MPFVKVDKRNRVTIPKEIVRKLGLKPGDWVEATLVRDKIIFTPKALNKKEDLWYWSEEGQRVIEESLDDKRAGRVKRFKDVEELIEDLNR